MDIFSVKVPYPDDFRLCQADTHCATQSGHLATSSTQCPKATDTMFEDLGVKYSFESDWSNKLLILNILHTDACKTHFLF